jgi:hypothetical protein
VLPAEVSLDANGLAKQNDLYVIMYHDLMIDNIDKVIDKIIKAPKDMEKDKALVTRAYNKKVKSMTFQVEDIVWKPILPVGKKSNKFGKLVTKLGRSL